MHPYSIDYDTQPFWEGVAARLSPILGDVEVTLGSSWMDIVDSLFNRADFLVVRTAQKYAGKLPTWYVLEWHDAASSICKDQDPYLAGESRVACVAHVLDTCLDYGVWPSEVRLDVESDITHFLLDGESFASIRRLTADERIPDASRERVEGLLLGLAKHGDAKIEMAKRLRKWPGLADIEISTYFSRPLTHWPCPTDWLTSARRLLEQTGVSEPDLNQVQRLVAAVFDIPSWNHLCGLMPSTSTKSDWWSLLAPYMVQGVHDGQVWTRNYVSAVAAFLDWRTAGADLIHDQKRLVLEYSFTTVLGSPLMSLSAQHLDSRLADSDDVFMFPIQSVEDLPDWETKILDSIQDGYTEGIERLMMVDLDLDEKLKRRAITLGRDLIAKDGPWRFYVKPPNKNNGSGALIAELYTGNGKKVGSAAVPLYKGALYQFDGIEGYVLSGDYHGNSPYAIIKGISAETLHVLADRLAMPSFGRDDEGGRVIAMRVTDWRNREGKAGNIKLMLEHMTQFGAVYPI